VGATATYGTCCTITATPESIYIGIPAEPVAISFKQIGGSCYFEAYVLPVAGATSYSWSTDNTNWTITTTNYWDNNSNFLPKTKWTVYVKTLNSCGSSAIKSTTLTAPAAPSGCMYAVNPNNDNEPSNSTNASGIAENNIAVSNATEMYPNPAQQSVNIKFEASKDDNYNINIFDMMGRRVYASNNYFAEGSHEVNVDLKDLPNGIYYVVAGNSDNRTSNKLIIAH